MRAPFLHVVTALLLSLAPWAFGESLRQQNLPAICKSLFPKILPTEKRPFTREEIRDLFTISNLSAAELEKKLSGLSPKDARELLEKLMLLRWQVPHLPENQVPDEIKPTPSEVLTTYPRALPLVAGKPEVVEKLSRSILKSRIWSTAETVASHLGKTSKPQDRLAMFKTFLDHLDYHDQSWHHQAQIDSMIDLAVGIQSKKISQDIQRANRREFNESHQGEETYSFAGPELLLTPYSEILNLFRSVGLKPGDKVVDLGAGFGRVGLALAAKFPGVSVTGYEIVRDRIQEGARIANDWNFDKRIHLLEQNLADPHFKPETADIYYAFNPVSGATFDKILEDLRTVGLQSGKPFRFIVFGPSPFYKTDAQPWLKELKGPGIPEGDELKVYEFVPEKASHTVIVDPGKITNPHQLRPASEITGYPRSQPLSSTHLKTLQDHLVAYPDSSRNAAAFMTPTYLSAWASGWPMEVSRHGNQLLISSKKTDSPDKETFVEPLGGTAQEKADLIRKVIADKKQKGIKAEFSFLSEPVYKLLVSDESISSSEAPEYFDFIYPAENLARLEKTKKLRDRAKQALSFESSHPDTRVEILSSLTSESAKEFQDAARGFLDAWLEHRLGAPDLTDWDRATLETETRGAKFLSESLKQPATVQIALRGPVTPEGSRPVIAYASGEITIDSAGKRTLIIYVQKSDGTKNAIPYINREMVKEVVDHPERYGHIDFVNMMDGATSGLRQFKMQYDPDLELGKTFRASTKE